MLSEHFLPWKWIEHWESFDAYPVVILNHWTEQNGQTNFWIHKIFEMSNIYVSCKSASPTSDSARLCRIAGTMTFICCSAFGAYNASEVTTPLIAWRPIERYLNLIEGCWWLIGTLTFVNISAYTFALLLNQSYDYVLQTVQILRLSLHRSRWILRRFQELNHHGKNKR